VQQGVRGAASDADEVDEAVEAVERASKTIDEILREMGDTVRDVPVVCFVLLLSGSRVARNGCRTAQTIELCIQHNITCTNNTLFVSGGIFAARNVEPRNMCFGQSRNELTMCV
jgi:enamine deaminase RidA (YjgF/YER057c/UK114 family)